MKTYAEKVVERIEKKAKKAHEEIDDYQELEQSRHSYCDVADSNYNIVVK